VLSAQRALPRRAPFQRRLQGLSTLTDTKGTRPPANADAEHWQATTMHRMPWAEFARPCTGGRAGAWSRAGFDRCVVGLPVRRVRFCTRGGTGSDRERAKLAEGVRTQNQMILVQSANEKCVPRPSGAGRHRPPQR